VLSLALTHVLTSAAHMIQHGVRRASALTAFWMLFSVYMVIDFWLTFWQLRDQAHWSLAFILFLLLQVSVIYVVARLATPETAPGEAVDMAGHFEQTRKRMFEVLGIYMLFAFTVNQLVPGFGDTFLKIMALSYVVLFFAASRIVSTNLQRAVAAATTAVAAVYSALYISGI
jgi:hypothetical protein